MKKLLTFILVLGLIVLSYFAFKKEETFKITGVISKIEENYFEITKDTEIYQFEKKEEFPIELEDTIEIEYPGTIKKEKPNKTISIQVLQKVDKNNIFRHVQKKVEEKLETMTLDEKIGQILFVRVPEQNKIEAIENYHLGGYVLFGRDFKSKTKEQVINEINEFQNHSKIPLLLGIDEEGGTVVRASSNPNLIDSPFKSSQGLYNLGGFDAIKEDTKKKSEFLASLGINVNLAPVADVSTSESDYMYKRSFGKDPELTSKFVETVIEESKKGKVSYTLKHFPGYGNNIDTHTGKAVDTRSYEDLLNNDIPPFVAGIKKEAEAILISHNTVTSIDPETPASLSKNIHTFLRKQLNFQGVIITDALDMGAIKNISNPYLKAMQSGNDLLIVTDYVGAFNEIKQAINEQTLEESVLNQAVTKVIAWKYYKELLVS